MQNSERQEIMLSFFLKRGEIFQSERRVSSFSPLQQKNCQSNKGMMVRAIFVRLQPWFLVIFSFYSTIPPFTVVVAILKKVIKHALNFYFRNSNYRALDSTVLRSRLIRKDLWMHGLPTRASRVMKIMLKIINLQLVKTVAFTPFLKGLMT